MRKLLFLTIGIFAYIIAIAQTPAGFSYQAVIRNTDGQVLVNQDALIKISLTNSDGSIVHYTETHAVTSNSFGLVDLVVGAGVNEVGNFTEIPWGTQSIYISIEFKLSGTTDYFPMGKQQLQSVPYALFAADGVGMEWLGSLSVAPVPSKRNQAYHNTTDSTSYIWDGAAWQVLVEKGAKGSRGETGAEGLQGEPGIDGIDGISIEWLGSFNDLNTPTATQINQAYHNTTDSTSYIWDGSTWQIIAVKGNKGAKGDTGNTGDQGLPGIDGLDGISMEWLGSYSETDIPTPTEINQAYYNTTDSSSYIWDGVAWQTITVKGPRGPKGETGNAGPQGDQGISGIDGSDGISMEWLGSFSESTIPTPTQINQAYHNTTDSTSYIWDGDSWGIITVKGSRGLKGDTGNAGPQGLQGFAGVDGISVVWLGSFPNTSVPTPTEINQAYHNTTDSTSYIWNGSAWQIITVKGAKGSKGEIGDQGPAGVGLTLRGGWSADSTYAEGDYVFSESSTTVGVNSMWICQEAVALSSTMPKDDGTHWVEFEAPEGAQGPIGPEGPKGDKGDTGVQGSIGPNGISIVWRGDFPTAPIDQSINHAYYNTTLGESFIWDGDSWETITKDGVQGEIGPKGDKGDTGLQGIAGLNGVSIIWQGSLATAPTSPDINFAYYNTSLKKSYVWDGNSWEILAQDGEQGETGPLVSGTTGQTLRHDGTSWVASTLLYNNGTSIGVGTTVANQTLSVRNDAGTPFSIHRYSSTTSDDVGILFKVYSTTTNLYHKGGIFLERTGTYGNGSLHFATTNAALTANVSKSDAKMTITSAGYVGIGTTSPTQLFDVNGTSRFRGLLYDYNNSYGLSGQVLTRGASGIEWQNPASNIAGSGAAGKIAYWSETSTLSSLNNISYANSLEVIGEVTADPDAPIFEVKNSAGDVIFGVYQEGVRINIKDAAISKGVKGGFAVGGLTNQTKAGPVEYFRITPDSARIYVKEEASAKGVKGGFAVGGLTNQTKTVVKRDLLFIAPDSARVYVDTSVTSKGVKGGFAVGGLTNQTKAQANSFFQLSKNNYFIGYESGKAITTGLYNSFFGHQSGMHTQSGKENIFIGYQSGLNNIVGNWNTFLGYKAGLANTGSDNTFIGFMAGSAHLNEGGNVYIGSKAGRDATHGQQNVYIGESAGLSTTYGKSNVFIGFESGMYNTGDAAVSEKGSYNVYLGYQAGKAGNTVHRNVFIGYQAGMNTLAGSITDEGNYNVFLGSEAGLTNTTGYANTAMGEQALKANTTGRANVAIGRRPLISNTTGIFNIAVGNTALYYNQSGKGNVAVGSAALGSVIESDHSVAVGEGALVLSLDSANVAVGPYALGYLRNGINNTAIGKKANVSVLMGTYNNTTAIGYGATITESNQIVIGNNDVTKFNVYGAYAAITSLGPNMYVNSLGQIMRSTSTFTSSSGTASKIAFWSDATTLTANSNLHWDNTNGRLGIGITSPASVLHINQSTGSLPIRITKSTTSNYWGFGVRVTGTDNDDLVFAYNGTTKGWVDDVDGSWDQASDSRLKSDIEPLGLVLNKVILLKPSSFYFKSNTKSGNKSIGFIAQEVEELFPNLVNSFTEDDGVTYKGLTYNDFAVLSIQSIIELNTKLENTVKNQEQTINNLQLEVNNLKAKMEEIIKAISK